MSPLAEEVGRILEAERDYPPMAAVSLVAVLKATGYPHGPAGLGEVQAALVELQAAGQVKRIFYPRSGEKWRAIQTAGPVAADETIRT